MTTRIDIRQLIEKEMALLREVLNELDAGEQFEQGGSQASRAARIKANALAAGVDISAWNGRFD